MRGSTGLPESWHQRLQAPFLAGMGALGLASQATEMEKVSRHSDACHQKLFGVEVPEGEGEMIVNTGEIKITHEAPVEKKLKFGTFAKLATGAGLLASGAGGYAGLMMVMDGAKEVVTEIEERVETRDRVPTYGFGDAE